MQICCLCSLYSIWGAWWAYQRPSPHMQGWVVTKMDLKLVFSLTPSLSFSLSHTLSFVRGVVQSVRLERYLFLPFLAGFRDPSSEKLTGPVQFPVSSPLSRLNCCALVRKWVSLFLGFIVLTVQMSNTYNQAHVFTHKAQICTFTHSYTYTIRRTSFLAQESSQGMTPNMVKMNCLLMTSWFKRLVYALLGCCHYPECESNTYTLQYWPARVLDL